MFRSVSAIDTRMEDAVAAYSEIERDAEAAADAEEDVDGWEAKRQELGRLVGLEDRPGESRGVKWVRLKVRLKAQSPLRAAR